MFPFFCFENREKWARQVGQSSFDLVDMSQFHSTSFRIIISYIFMYVQIIITLAVYASDIYTAIMLLAFDRWASSITPYVPFHISRWLFGGCILFSFVLLIYDYIQAYRVWKRYNICLTYTNPICRTIYSIKGFNYFCLFAKITKSKEFTDYVALFVFFTFKGWANLLLAEGPRQVLNALTLYSVLKIDDDFVGAVTALAEKSHVEAVVVSFMAFSLLVWVISMCMFILAVLCSCSVWTQVKRHNCHSLEEYCCVRIDKRVAYLVRKYHKRGMQNLALENSRMSKQPTLPTIEFLGTEEENVGYNDSSTRLAPYGSSKTNLLAADQVADDFYSHKEYSLSDLQPYDSRNTLAEPSDPLSKAEFSDITSIKRSDTESSNLTVAGVSNGVYKVPRKPTPVRQASGSLYQSENSSSSRLYQNPDISNSGGSINTYLEPESQSFTYSPPRYEPMDYTRRPSDGRRPSDHDYSRRPSDHDNSRRPSDHDNSRRPSDRRPSEQSSTYPNQPHLPFQLEPQPSNQSQNPSLDPFDPSFR
ncbi:putative vacuolar membrane protein [Yarrowia sp. B02]|nr:putative vacuolar membrane protein [Yarrowia sp. B02]